MVSDHTFHFPPLPLSHIPQYCVLLLFESMGIGCNLTAVIFGAIFGISIGEGMVGVVIWEGTGRVIVLVRGLRVGCRRNEGKGYRRSLRV